MCTMFDSANSNRTTYSTFTNVKAFLKTYNDTLYMSSSTTIDTLLPSQSGNSGKLLTTNGSVASWTDAPAGASLSYVAVTASGNATQGNFYGVTSSGSDITLTVADGTVAGQALSVKKLDNTDSSLILSGKIDGDTEYVMTLG